MTKQQFTSKGTSISVVNKIYTNKDFACGSNILDYGGGKYDKNIEYMAHKGCKVVVYDPYNRSDEYNKATMSFVASNPIHYVVCSNVLNVIKEQTVLCEVLNNIATIQRKNKGCRVYIAVYEGNKTGVPAETSKGWQRNLPTKGYLDIISKFMPISEVKNGIIVC